MDAELIVLPKFCEDRLHFCVRTRDAILSAISISFIYLLPLYIDRLQTRLRHDPFIYAWERNSLPC